MSRSTKPRRRKMILHQCQACGAARLGERPGRHCRRCSQAALTAAREAALEAALAEPAPARYAPGTPEAVALLAARHARGERLWAAGDVATCEGLAGPHPGIVPGQKGPHRGESEPWRAEREPHAYPSHPRGRR